MSAATCKGKPADKLDHCTVSELAALIGKSDRTVERWAKAGKLPEPFVTEHGWKLWSPKQVREVLDRVMEEL